MKRALLLVDIQNDFLPGGALAVRQGDAVIAVANRLIPHFDVVVATQDWHPPGHGSFAANHAGKQPGETVALDGLPQVLWPVHCVQGTRGSEFAGSLQTSRIDQKFTKGANRNVDSYSGFFDNGHRQSTGLGDYLKANRVEAVYVCGLATDYCVKFTAVDAVASGSTPPAWATLTTRSRSRIASEKITSGTEESGCARYSPRFVK